MTTIAVSVSETYCSIVGESGITDESFQTMPPMRKIVRQHEWLIAAAGTDRTCDVLQYLTKYPPIPETMKLKNQQGWYEWIAKRIVPIIRKSAQAELSLEIKDGVAEIPESELILVTHGKAFAISASLGISRLDPYWAVGSGGSVALGALATYNQQADWSSKHSDYCMKAIQTATRHDSFSHPPVYGYASYPSGKIKELEAIAI